MGQNIAQISCMVSCCGLLPKVHKLKPHQPQDPKSHSKPCSRERQKHLKSSGKIAHLLHVKLVSSLILGILGILKLRYKTSLPTSFFSQHLQRQNSFPSTRALPATMTAFSALNPSPRRLDFIHLCSTLDSSFEEKAWLLGRVCTYC